MVVADRPSSVLLLPPGLLPSPGPFPVALCSVPVVGGWSNLRRGVLFLPRRPYSTISCAFSSSWKLSTSDCTSRGSGKSGSWRNSAFAPSTVSNCCSSSSFLPAACSLPLPQTSFPRDGSTNAEGPAGPSALSSSALPSFSTGGIHGNSVLDAVASGGLLTHALDPRAPTAPTGAAEETTKPGEAYDDALNNYLEAKRRLIAARFEAEGDTQPASGDPSASGAPASDGPGPTQPS